LTNCFLASSSYSSLPSLQTVFLVIQLPEKLSYNYKPTGYLTVTTKVGLCVGKNNYYHYTYTSEHTFNQVCFIFSKYNWRVFLIKMKKKINISLNTKNTVCKCWPDSHFLLKPVCSPLLLHHHWSVDRLSPDSPLLLHHLASQLRSCLLRESVCLKKEVVGQRHFLLSHALAIKEAPRYALSHRPPSSRSPVGK